METIKVVHIITKLELGGAQQNTIYTLANIDKGKFIPVLICGKGGILDSDVEKKDFKVYFIPHLVREINPFYDVMALFEIYRILRKENACIVHTHSSKAGIIGRWAARLARRRTNTAGKNIALPRIIHTFHGFGFNDYQRSIVKYMFVVSEKVTAKITDKFVAVSQMNIKKGIENKIGKPGSYVLIRSGIKIKDYTEKIVNEKLKRNELRLREGEKLITTIGPFKPQKNLGDFIKAARIVNKKREDVKFVIIGDGEEREKLENMIRINELTNNVLLLGWRRDIPDILRITDIFVMTSLWEGLPRSVVEAMVSGKPVIAYAVDGVSEVVKENITGFLVEPGNYNVTGEKVLELLANTSMLKKFAENAKISIDRSFDIDFMVRQQEELYSNICGNQVILGQVH